MEFYQDLMPARQVLTKTEAIQELLKFRETIPRFDDRKIPFYRELIRHEKFVRLDGKVFINTFFPPLPSKALRSIVANYFSHPVITHIVTTNKCHGKCSYCNYTPTEREMTTSQLKNVIAELQALKVSVIGFTGGESLLRQDLEELIASVDDRSSTILYTSGLGLTREKAARLKEAGLGVISISLDHYERERNDAHRFPGSFAMALEAVSNALRSGLFTVTSVVVRKETLDDLEPYIHFVNTLGVHGIRVLDIVPSGACIATAPLTPQERRRIVDIHKKVNADPALPQLTTLSYLEGAGLYGCGAGVFHMYVDCEGNLRPCDFVPIRFGNVLEEPLPVVYGRMRQWFSLPKKDCFMKKHHCQVERLLNTGTEVSHAAAEELLAKVQSDPCATLWERYPVPAKA